jgi:aryl-alcohol dehydrogenase-like predicted oxidoreductase
MPLIPIPSTDVRVSPICLGTADWDTLITADAIPRLLDTYLQLGGNFLDSAHCYAAWLPNGEGRSERALGRAVRQLNVRDRVIIATKGGHPTINEHYQRPPQYLSRQVVQTDLAQSLDRLGMDRIDLYYLHRDDGITPVAEIIEMMNEFVRAKQIRYFAASNWSTARIQQANAYATAEKLQCFCCSQICFSLATPTWPIGDTDPTMRYAMAADRRWHTQHQFAVVSFSSTARGYFAGATDTGYETPENAARLTRTQHLAKELGTTPHQLALAWLMNQPFPVIPITGTVKPHHLQDTLSAASIRLTAQQVQSLE